MSAAAFPYGTLTRPFPPNPTSFVPKSPDRATDNAGEQQDSLPGHHGGARASRVVASAAGDEGDAAWRKKQFEIRELQQANRSLMQRVSSSRSAASSQGEAPPPSLPWPLPPPLPPSPSAEAAAAAPPAGGAAAALAAYLPAARAGEGGGGGGGEAGEGPSRAALLRGQLGLVEQVALLREEVLELRQAAGERERELAAQRAGAQRAGAALAEAEGRVGELSGENAALRSARALVEQLEGGEGASYRAIRNYIDGDLEAMRAERRDAEALLRRGTKRWEEAAERSQAQCEAAADRQAADARRIEALRSECRAAKLAAEEAAVCADEAVERRLQRAKSQVENSEVAVQKLRQQLEARGAENAKGIERLRRSESAVADQQAQQDSLSAKLWEAEQEAAAANQHLAEFKRRSEARGAEAAAEHRQLQEDLESQEAAAAEERRRLRREASRRAAEHQALGSEAREEAEELAARARETERGLHAKLSGARQERQRVEGKLRAQLQALQAELHEERGASHESREVLGRWRDELEEVTAARSEAASAEKQCLAIRQQHAHTTAKMQKKNEHLQNELRAVCEEAKRAIQSEMLEERDRCLEEAWQRLSVVEERHSQHIAQLHEARDTELGFITEQGRMAQGKLEQRIEALESAASARAFLLEGESAQVEALSCAQETLQAELADARGDAEGALEEHEALLEVLRREHKAADVQFQQLLLQAEERQRKLGRLQGDGVLEDIIEASPHFHASPSSMTTRCSTALPRPLPSLPILHSNGCSPRSSAHGGSSARGPLENDDVDNVLRSLQQEREVRRAQRLSDEFARVLARAEEEAGRVEGRGSPPPQWPDACRLLFGELLALYERAQQAGADDELRLAALREREAAARAQLRRAEARQASLGRAELRGGEREAELERLEGRLEGAEAEAGEEAARCDELRAELDDARLDFRRRAREAQDAARSEAAGARAACEESAAEAWAELRRAAALPREDPRTEALESELGNLRKECREELLELREARTKAATGRCEVEAAFLQEQRGWLQERESLQKAHGDERSLLVAEIQQFQKEKLMADELIRRHGELLPRLEAELAEAEAALAERAAESQEAGQHLRTLQLDEELRADAEAQLALELQERAGHVMRAREQLHATREERMREKLRHDKLVERLRARVDALERREAAQERHCELSERHESRQAEEYAQRLEHSRREVRQVGAKLHQAQVEEQSVQHRLEVAAVQLGSAEEKCCELSGERSEIESIERALRSEHKTLEETSASQHQLLQSAQLWGNELAQRLQAAESNAHREAQMDRDAGFQRYHTLNMEANELQTELSCERETTRQLHLTIKSECQQVLPLLSAEDSQELAEQLQSGAGTPEAAVMQTLRAVARQVAGLARENAELRQHSIRPAPSHAGSVGTEGAHGAALATGRSGGAEAAAKVAALQKELIKLREQNQELLHEKRLQEQRTAADLAAAASRLASDTSGPRPSGPGGGPENVYMRHQLKQAQQAKARAEAALEDLRQDLQRRSSSLQAEVERLQAALSEEQRRREAEQAQAQKRARALEQKAKALEAKLSGRAEAQQHLAAEKEAVEQQLGVAAQQLEALLADEHKEGDLQRDLASLSKQFEQLHGKHRAQLAKAAEQGKQLQHEEAARFKLAQELQEQAKKLRAIQQEECAYERDLVASRSEQADSAREALQLRSWQQQQTAAAQELEDQVQRLREELVHARENNPRSREAIRHIKQKELELGEMREELESAEAARRRCQAEARMQAAELAELRSASESRPEPRDNASIRRHPRLPQVPGRNYERGYGSPQMEEPVLVITAEDSDADTPSQQQEKSAAYVDTHPTEDLDDILSTLSSHERELLQHKSTPELDSKMEAEQLGQGRAESHGVSSQQPTSGGTSSMEEAEKEFGQVARSLGFAGDVETLWEEAKARAAVLEAPAHTFDDLPVQGPPVAADVDLSRVGRKVMRGYPDSPPGQDPSQQPGRPPEPPAAAAAGGAASPSSPLLVSTQEAFQQAEALCEQQRFKEAVPLFQHVLQAVDGGQESHAPPGFIAEVWAHLGVAVQSLDHVPEAIRCYKKAMANDPTLHVCCANLATLHAYLREHESAMEYICQALALDPQNETYIRIKRQLDEGHGRGGSTESANSQVHHDGHASAEVET